MASVGVLASSLVREEVSSPERVLRPSLSNGSQRNASPQDASELVSTSEDRRIVRSKRALRHALIALMEEKGFEAITVNDLCSAADLNRGTFYNHFKDKEHLLASLEDDVMQGIDAIQSKMTLLDLKDVMAFCIAKHPLPILVDLFDYLREQGDFLHAVLGPGGDIRFGPKLRETVCTNLVQGVLHKKYRNTTDPFVGYYLSFYSSAYLGVITRWIETGMNEDSQQMAQIAMRLLFIKPGEPIRL